MKLIIKIALGIILALFVLVGIVTCVGSCLDFDDEEQTEEYEEERTDDYYEDDDENENNADGENIAPGEGTTSTSSSWGDGTCRAINAKQFYQLVASKKQYDTYIGEGPCVIDFWADWCGYCKRQKSELEQMDQVWLGQVNAEKSANIAKKYSINAFPTFLLFKNGKDIERFSGMRSKEELMAHIMRHIR